ncbi:hypothetical protein LC087_13390 [Bacillus carboniphilus]|uniref:Uncharacterized protein n=1 Tax=Bacillus carboniphilus TaxID=86663 RepID=A0ABY9JR01_9BACI|nr:hypothetical protein [Bacillus carboniphilus]WLR41829.1 hypothetical protein LC087_13390 [Bacillus carboniphilus]
MVENKKMFFSSIITLTLSIILGIYFMFPENKTYKATMIFMSNPVRNQDGFILLGVIGSILFIASLILLVKSTKKYHFIAFILVIVLYVFIPKLIIGGYQETLATGIHAISYDGNGSCDFEKGNEFLLKGQCEFVLHNRSNEEISFELEFLDSFFCGRRREKGVTHE